MLPLVVLLAACEPQNDLTVLKPNILVTPEVLDFGDVVRQYSGDGSIEVLNGGQGELKISEVTLSGEGEDAFEVGAWEAELDHDQAFTLPVAFYPKDPLPYTAILTVHSNDEDTPEQTVTLLGQGIVAPTPDIDCDTLALDFETVEPGDIETKFVTCENIGDDDLTIADLTNMGSGQFDVVNDPTGSTIGPGEEFQIIVMYAPVLDSGDSGSLTIETNDPDEAEVEVLLVANGGSNDEYPVAVVSGPLSAEPRTSITINGGESYDPNGYDNPLEYFWSVTGPDDGLECEVYGTDCVLQLDLAGTYEVELQVENTRDLLSAPAVYTVDAIPTEQLHVELLWEDSADIDLHLLTSEGVFFTDPYDCNWCNMNPDWGEAGSSDDPTLDLDAWEDPPGAENINIDEPADGSYLVKVHYFEENGASDVTATVNIYLYGVLEASYSRVLSRNKIWDVAQITWPDGYVIEESTDLYASEFHTCQ